MEKLNCESLMIGDWVLTLDSTHKEKVFAQVDAIEEGKHSILVTRECSNWFVDIDWIESVLLTPEILEKNGFEDVGDNIYQLEEKPCWFWVDFFNHWYGCEYDTSTYEYEDNEHRLKLYGIPSVHELQHALRLLGIEKKIVL